jgi:hypothetical protein
MYLYVFVMFLQLVCDIPNFLLDNYEGSWVIGGGVIHILCWFKSARLFILKLAGGVIGLFEALFMFSCNLIAGLFILKLINCPVETKIDCTCSFFQLVC